MTNEPNSNVQEEDLEREALVAKKRIESNLSSFKDIHKSLLEVHDFLDKNLIINQKITKVDIPEMKEHPDIAIFTKKRNKLEYSPDRLWFIIHGIYFYIEFTIRSAKNDEKRLEGCLIYGISCYNEKEKVEDIPIVSFFIDNHGIIKANNDFEDESWTCEEKYIIDLHLRTLDKILEEALFVINKNKF